MSRIGKNPIAIPKDVKVDYKDSLVTATGPKGSQSVKIHQDMVVNIQDAEIMVERPSDNKLHRSLHGTTRQIIHNAVAGVHVGFSKELEIRGIGYQATMQGKRLLSPSMECLINTVWTELKKKVNQRQAIKRNQRKNLQLKRNPEQKVRRKNNF